jgi:cholesterol transport system auxiliary component
MSRLVTLSLPPRAGLLLAIALMLANCASLLPKREGPSPALFQLTAAKSFPGAERALDIKLSVDEPAAPRALDIDRIAIKPSPYELKYLAGARWSDRAPRMLQMLLVESFDNAMTKGGVGRPGEGLRTDYLFTSELRNFEVDDTGAGRPRARVRLSAKLLTVPGGRLIAAQSFAHEAQAGSRSTGAVVEAFDEAFNGVAVAAVTWTLQTLGARAANGERPVAQREPAAPAADGR